MKMDSFGFSFFSGITNPRESRTLILIVINGASFDCLGGVWRLFLAVSEISFSVET